MRSAIVLLALSSTVLAAIADDAQAQLFRRWRRANNGYTTRYYPTYNNGTVTRSYRAGSLQPGAAPVAAAPTYAAPTYAAPSYGSNGGYLFNGPSVPPGPAGLRSPHAYGAGANPQYGAAPGGVGAGFGAGMGPAGSKLGSGTGQVGRP